MRPPKRTNEKIMPKELLDEAKKVQDILFNPEIPDDTADATVDEFNARWRAAGGAWGDQVVNRNKIKGMLK